MKIHYVILGLAIAVMGACGGVDKEDICDFVEGQGKYCDVPVDPTPTMAVATPAPGRTPTPRPPAKVTPKPTVPAGMNPWCATVPQPSPAHLLWKPRSDTSGNAVAVFDGKYVKEFLSVKGELKTGQYEDFYWKGLVLWGNPDSAGPRQHWRSKNVCSKFKDKAKIFADDGYQTCAFVLPGDACKRYE